MSFLSTLIAFVVTLGVLIVVHEYGHYWVARRCGVKVLRFSVGFGRPILRAVRGPDRTEWVVSAIPLGGYVRMLDERDEEAGPIPAADLPRAFNRQPVGKRIAIVLAGPLANLLLAVFVYWVLNVVGVAEPRAVIGPPTAESPAARAGLRGGDLVVGIDDESVRSWNDMRWLLLDRAVDRAAFDLDVEDPDGNRRRLRMDLSAIDARELDADLFARLGLTPPETQPVVRALAAGGAAEAAGMQVGDRFVAIDGKAISSARDVSDAVRAAPQRPLHFEVQRGGDRLALTLTPDAVSTKDGARIGRIGVDFRDVIEVRYGPIESVGLAFKRTWDTALFSLRMLGKMVTGDASWKNLSGPVTIADYAGQTARIGVTAFLSFLALVSISLGVLNLLPVPLLDGGHLLYYAIEIIKGSPPAEWVIHWGQRAGIGLLVFLTALALYNDVMRLLS
jgi:regulator of sigma E protease